MRFSGEPICVGEINNFLALSWKTKYIFSFEHKKEEVAQLPDTVYEEAERLRCLRGHWKSNAVFTQPLQYCCYFFENHCIHKFIPSLSDENI